MRYQYDSLTREAERLLDRGDLVPELAVRVSQYLAERKAQFDSGLKIVSPYVQERLQGFDSELRARVSFEDDGFVLERYALGSWHKVCTVMEPDSRPLPKALMRWKQTKMKLTAATVDNFIEILRRHDMQRYSVKEYARQEMERAHRVRKTIKRDTQNKREGFIDNLSNKQIADYQGVVAAVHRGDKIIAHGDDLKQLEAMDAERKRQLAAGEATGYKATGFASTYWTRPGRRSLPPLEGETQ